jgi:fucose permease
MIQTSFLADQMTLVLVALTFLQIKHYVCDFILQRPYQYLNKGKYGHPGGIIHAGLHIIATCLLFVLITPSVKLGVAIIVGEFVVHYHIDWLKEQVMKRTGWQTTDNGYWWALGADQLLHQLSYVAIAGVLVHGVS